MKRGVTDVPSFTLQPSSHLQPGLYSFTLPAHFVRTKWLADVR